VIGQRAVELALRSEEARRWYAMNTRRWGQLMGVTRLLFLLPTVREEIDIIFTKAEEHYRKGLQIDPHFTVLRVQLARLLIAAGRHDDTRRELDGVASETRPSSPADWIVKDLPRARELLTSLKDRT
jgi:hypothetical protein